MSSTPVVAKKPEGEGAAAIEVPLEVIGDFVVPPPDGPPSHNFQTLHLDFGLPLDP